MSLFISRSDGARGGHATSSTMDPCMTRYYGEIATASDSYERSNAVVAKYCWQAMVRDGRPDCHRQSNPKGRATMSNSSPFSEARSLAL